MLSLEQHSMLQHFLEYCIRKKKEKKKELGDTDHCSAKKKVDAFS